MNRSPTAARGAAIILAMLVAALAAAVAVTLITDEARWMSSVETKRDYTQAKTLASAGVQWARLMLYEDQRGGEIDHLRESWAFPLPPTPLENGAIKGQIIDLQGKINLNNLLPTSSMRRAERARLRQLAKTLDIDDASVNTILARFQDVRERGKFENDEARPSLTVASVPPLFDAGELIEQSKLSAAALRKLAPHIVALPIPTPLNVNTSAAETLKAALPNATNDEISRLIALRDTKPFRSIAEFRGVLPETIGALDESALSVNSRFFLITVHAQQGNARSEAQALLRRNNDQPPTIIWKTVE
ncbi:MAG: type II secretion system minor pseudopilin GspK [Burkholderiales bacterium]|jgi:general secretion pathway protein K|nr:type II secretion system minor pseudopilin GspK [Burkholderiales bacterium]